MRLFAPLSLLLLLPNLTISTSSNPTAQQQPSPPTLRTATLHHLPSLPSPSALSARPTPLATLSYSPSHPHLSRLTSFTPPQNSTSLVQIGICFSENTCRTSAAYAYAFYPPYEGRFQIVVGEEGVLAVAWTAGMKSKVRVRKGNGNGEKEKRYEEGGKGDFDIRVQAKAPGVWVDRAPGAYGRGAAGAGEKGMEKRVGAPAGEGEGEEVEEKSLLQRYWWVILAVTVFAMAGGGGDK
ncbi:MAG: hypothetical protein Q9184_007661 [Pyrenodesmia sp. 2 TL-2023]